MENLKIRVNNEEESKEAQELFFELGYGRNNGKTKEVCDIDFDFLFAYGDDLDLTHTNDENLFKRKNHKQISLGELRALVSLHKNPINMDKVLSEVRSDALGLLNDQYAEIEQVRQESQAWANPPVGRCADAESSKHNHYFIDVSDVDEIDFYEIALRYNVTDPCIQHILKKCLAVGNRGHKDFHTDLKDIYDTAARALRIHGG